MCYPECHCDLGRKLKCVLLKTSISSHAFEYVRLECSTLADYKTFNQTKKADT